MATRRTKNSWMEQYGCRTVRHRSGRSIRSPFLSFLLIRSYVRIVHYRRKRFEKLKVFFDKTKENKTYLTRKQCH